MKKMIGLTSAMLFSLPVFAQSISGTVITLAGNAEIKADNDQAVVTFFIEEQDKDKAVAASRVNQKMKAGTELIKKEDPQAELHTRGYYSYPIYNDATKTVAGQAPKQQLVGWRTGQYLEVKTQNLKQLPSTAAAAQSILALNGVNFGLSDATIAKLESERIAAGYKDFSQKLTMITHTMGKNPEDVVIESLDFDNAGSNMRPMAMAAEPMMLRSARAAGPVDAPSFEPGYTSLSIHITGKLKLK
ncbi:SIMPL domain-containing protein [Undibacterium jejuense]|uniref:SIMPL domain-containing protein n=1 Tax=Undibacterium jejuense TaxID=1344949 RepID=A0A923HNL2_9BURK|nr:SIMPL domain-containing protein [Undibacterium jejuense]MBC3861923.1 SIMPL domain-containing protein [Undibacterium jejuense]